MGSQLHPESAVFRFHLLGLQCAISRLALAVQVRYASKHTCISHGSASVFTAGCHSTRTSRMGFAVTDVAVCGFTLVLDRLVARQKAAHKWGPRRDERRMDCASPVHDHLCRSVVDSRQPYELHLDGHRRLDGRGAGNESIRSPSKPRASSLVRRRTFRASTERWFTPHLHRAILVVRSRYPCPLRIQGDFPTQLDLRRRATHLNPEVARCRRPALLVYVVVGEGAPV